MIGLSLLLFYPGDKDRTVSEQENRTENQRRTETEKPAGEGKAQEESGKEDDEQNRRPKKIRLTVRYSEEGTPREDAYVGMLEQSGPTLWGDRKGKTGEEGAVEFVSEMDGKPGPVGLVIFGVNPVEGMSEGVADLGSGAYVREVIRAFDTVEEEGERMYTHEVNLEDDFTTEMEVDIEDRTQKSGKQKNIFRFNIYSCFSSEGIFV